MNKENKHERLIPIVTSCNVLSYVIITLLTVVVVVEQLHVHCINIVTCSVSVKKLVTIGNVIITC